MENRTPYHATFNRYKKPPIPSNIPIIGKLRAQSTILKIHKKVFLPGEYFIS